MTLKSIEKLSPFLARKIWGSEALTRLKSGTSNASELPIGESFEVSRLEGQSGKLSNGEELGEVINFEDLPYLVKIIETSDNLSIQVHPDDDYALRVENSTGKTECWLILDSEDEAGIFLGLRPGVDKVQLSQSIHKGEDVSKLLNFYPVRPGEFFYVPAGTIHAIGKGIRLAEVQQSSGITYRVWDWNRVDKLGNSRELHIDKALDVINFEVSANDEKYFLVKKALFDAQDEQRLSLIMHKDFNLELFTFSKVAMKKSISIESLRFSSVLNLSNEIKLSRGNEVIKLNQYESVLVDKDCDKELIIENNLDSLFLFIS